MNPLQKAILRTLVYFDIFDYPLTLMEVWKWLYADNANYRERREQSRTIANIQGALNQLPAKIQSKNGFYFLKGRAGIIQTRLSRYNISEEKFKRAIKFIKILRFIPFIRCLIVCNRLGYSNVHPNSDIDIAVIAPKNRLWLTRLLAVGFLSILKVRPRQIERAKAIDLSFFVSDDDLNLESLKFKQELVFPYWVGQFIPVYDDGIYIKFIKENSWLKRYLPNFFPYQLNQQRTVGNGCPLHLIRRFLRLLSDWDFLERWAKNYQLKILPADLKLMMNQDSRVVVNDKVLRFHRRDSWGEAQRKFDRTIEYLNI